MLELFYSNVKSFHVCMSKFNFSVINELFVYQTRLISDFCTILCNIVGNSHVTFLHLSTFCNSKKLLLAKILITCNEFFCQDILMGFLTFEGVAFVLNCTFCTFVLEDTFLFGFLTRWLVSRFRINFMAITIFDKGTRI